MDLHPDVAEAAAQVRRMYDLGLTCFDCARSYWVRGVRKNVFLTSKTTKRTRKETGQELETWLRTLAGFAVLATIRTRSVPEPCGVW